VKLSSEVSSDKLRGGFYSPDALVTACWNNVMALVDSRDGLKVLEPSVGDGAFIRGLAKHQLRARVARMDAVELVPEEASRAEYALQDANLSGHVREGSFLNASMDDLDGYDAVVGNPPFLRYQFVNSTDLDELASVEARAKTQIGRVSNLWIPIFLSAVSRLRDGGVFSFILPSEFLTGVSGAVVRTWLAERSDELQVELFPPRSFPKVLQEIVIVSGRVGRKPSGVLVVRDNELGAVHRHHIESRDRTWTAFTLSPAELAALREARKQIFLRPLGEVAKLSVSTVTGANDFFTYDEATRARYELAPFSRQMVARTRHAPGLDLTVADWEGALEAGEKSWLLDVAASEAEPNDGLLRYLREAEREEIQLRYKTRIRTPWYQVPIVESRPLLLSKRSHRFPRLIANSAQLLTTDTIYQGIMAPEYRGFERRLVAGFHNSLTLLTAEIEGRSFGGGVLELVPSEVARLAVFDPRSGADNLGPLDALARQAGYESDALVDATNGSLLASVQGLDPYLLTAAEVARQRLLARRMGRGLTS
jgi:adenine-specific DNA-methyltransferase